MQSFELERPPHLPNPLSRDLVKVLVFLRDARFEHLSSCDFHFLTMKVLFFISLAATKRVSELHALSQLVAFQGKALSISYLPKFVAKTESERNPLPQFFLL